MKKEADIQREICDYLFTRNDLFFWRSNNIPAPRRSMPKYSAKGLCDICLIKNSQFIAIEVKRPDGFYKDRIRKSVQSQDQKDFSYNIEKNGATYLLVTTLQEVKDFLNRHFRIDEAY